MLWTAGWRTRFGRCAGFLLFFLFLGKSFFFVGLLVFVLFVFGVAVFLATLQIVLVRYALCHVVERTSSSE
jgi:hypothetical protein